MKPGRLQEATAAIWLGIALVNGGTALHYDHEAGKAQVITQIYEVQGNQQQAELWNAYTDNQEQYRNINLGLIAIDLGLATFFGVGAAASISAARRREQEQPTQPATPEA